MNTNIFESDQSELQSVVPTLYVGKICGNCILNAKICIEYATIVYYQSMPNMQQSNAEYAASNAKYAAHLELGAQLALGVHS